MMKFTRLEGEVGNVSALIRLKRLGKIRLGIKKKHAASGREYPSATDHDGKPIDYFVIPPELQEILGEKPKVIHGMFASNNPEEVYVEELAMYGASSGLKCHGNGKVALRRNENGEWIERKCPCEFLKTDLNPKGQCTAKGDLKITLPQVSMWGYFQITTHSIFARAGILSSLKHLQEQVGRIAYIPIKLSRVPQEIVHDGTSKTHYIVGFDPELTLPQIISLRTTPELMVLPAQFQLEEAPDTNPADDPVDVVVEQDEREYEAAELAEMDEAQLKDVQAKLAAQREKGQETGREASSVKSHAAAPVQHPTSSDAPVPPLEYATVPKQKKPQLTMVPETRDAASSWAEIVTYIDANPELCTLKADWKQEHNVTNVIRLNPIGQQELLKYIREKVSNFPY